VARIPRTFSVRPNSSVHKIWRGHNREWNLGTDEQKKHYLEFLNEDLESQKFDAGAVINALTLMSNHGHEVYQVKEPKKFSGHMRRHHSRYGSYFNRENNRCGKVAQDRPKTCLIGDVAHEMRAVFYIHANPVRAGIVGDAKDYEWSTHRFYAFGKKAKWMKNIQLPDWYLNLGKTAELRQRKYRKLFSRYMRDSGKFKQGFVNRLFYGPCLWVAEQEDLVAVWKRQHLPP
jgi:putative transposase